MNIFNGAKSDNNKWDRKLNFGIFTIKERSCRILVKKGEKNNGKNKKLL
jgi:hypothetical protein